MSRAQALSTHALEFAADAALAGVAFAGPAAALLLPRLPRLGARPLPIDALRLAYRARWASIGAASLAFAALLRRRRGPEQRLAIAADALSIGAMLALAPALYRTELGLTRVRGLRHLGPEAHALLHDDAEVAGLVLGGRAVAYPASLLGIARPFLDVVGGVRVAPILDRKSHAALALLAPERGLKLARLGTPENHVLLYDRRRGDAFRPLAGVVEAGPDRGRALALHPLLRCSWSTWRTLHPDTALAWWSAPPAHRLLHRFAARDLTVRHVPEERLSRPLDPRLAPAEQIFALRTGGVAHGFTRFHLRKHPVTSLRLGNRQVAVLYDRELDVAQAFFAEVDGQPLRLERHDGLHAVARDARGDLYDVSGRCVKGAAYGTRLEPVPLSLDRVFWFAWAHFHPHTGLDGWASTAQRYALSD